VSEQYGRRISDLKEERVVLFEKISRQASNRPRRRVRIYRLLVIRRFRGLVNGIWWMGHFKWRFSCLLKMRG